MIATLINDRTIQLSNLTTHEDDVLWREFSVVKPGMEFIDPEQVGLWDGVYRFYNRARSTLARPLLSKLRAVCQQHNLPLNVQDDRPPSPHPPPDPQSINYDFLPGITLDEHQLRSIRAACVAECGTFDIPPSGGKTEVIAGICKAIPCQTVILADQIVVIEQIKQRLELRDVIEEVGLFCSGRRPNGELIMVGSIQSLATPTKPPVQPVRTEKDSDATYKRKLKNYDARTQAFKTRQKNAQYLQGLVRGAHMLICDEVDRGVSTTHVNLIRNTFRGRRRYGFSGSIYDDDKPVENMRIQQLYGSVIARETQNKLLEIKRIVPIEVFMFAILGNREDAATFDIAYREHLTDSPRFWGLLHALLLQHRDTGTLVLVDKTDLGLNLERYLAEQGMDVPYIYGKTTQKRRNAVLRAFESRDYKAIIGGKIINRGLDLRGGCENLIIASSGKLSSDLKQKLGRSFRQNQQGYSRVYCFYFRCNTHLYRHSRLSLQTLVNLGHPTTVIFPGGTIEGAQFINSRYHIPKRMLVVDPQPQLF